MDIGRNCNGKRKKRSIVLAAALASLVAVLGGVGCSTAQPFNANDARDAARIEEALQEKLARDGRLSRITSVKVNPANGIVTLSGRVTTDAERDAAGKLASSVKGVAMIYNEIQVEKPGPDETHAAGIRVSSASRTPPDAPIATSQGAAARRP